jgi:hypothetical protein
MQANNTRNQHFVAQVEQRLNAIGPSGARGKGRIYSFRVVNRDGYQIALENARGRAIASTLSMLDLFSFDVKGGGRIRGNLETLFQKYEENIEMHTKGLLKKLADNSNDIKAEIIDLFASKLLNFVRNPFCIEKVLNSFPGLTDYGHGTSRDIPTDYHGAETAPGLTMPAAWHLAANLRQMAAAAFHAARSDRRWPAQPV